MASNVTTSQDENGDYDDWIELFNTTEYSISLGDLYLSDDLLNLTKWQIPAQTIAANDYLIIWADSDESQNSLHANFKLSSAGETLFLADANGQILDSVSFTQQLEDVSYGRYPNGIGAFSLLSPTFNANNNTADSIPISSKLLIDAFPVPSDNSFYLSISSQQESNFELFDVLGKLVYEKAINAGITETEISIADYKPGIYFVTVRNSDQVSTLKMVKL